MSSKYVSSNQFLMSLGVDIRYFLTSMLVHNKVQDPKNCVTIRQSFNCLHLTDE